ncbi:MAG: hypothetical protein EHM12_08195 [Dehalococcoidia bacterium]|nr:MAG: hypothetical protein EHM12_08195 [Dehalococcoidia bacterium]
MLDIAKNTFLFLFEIMKSGVFYFPFIFTILIIDYLKHNIYSKNMTKQSKSLVTLALSLVMNFIIVFVNYSIFVNYKILSFMLSIYFLNVIGNFAMSCFTVNIIDVLKNFIIHKLSGGKNE